MKFSIQNKTLLSHMVSVGKVIGNKNAIAILGSFLFDLNGSTLTITGSDQENLITTRLAVEAAEGNGKFCIDAKRILSLLKATPDNLITMEIDDATLAVLIKYTNGQYDLVAQKGEEYPLGTDIDESAAVAELTLPASQITNCLGMVSFAVGSDDFRPNLQGVFWDVMEDAIVFVATDTRQLAKYRSTQTAPGVKCSFILPAKTVAVINNIIGKESSVKITVCDKCVYFVGENFSIRAALLNGRYPDYNRVIPKDNNKVITIDRVALSNAVKRVSLCADNQYNTIQFALSPMDVLVSAQDINFGMGGKESVPCTYTGGDDMHIGFSGSYLSGLLDTLSTAEINIKLSDQSRPGLFLPAENDEFGELTLLCMPTSISNISK